LKTGIEQKKKPVFISDLIHMRTKGAVKITLDEYEKNILIILQLILLVKISVFNWI
jgi:hypothetical protein